MAMQFFAMLVLRFSQMPMFDAYIMLFHILFTVPLTPHPVDGDAQRPAQDGDHSAHDVRRVIRPRHVTDQAYGTTATC